MLSESVKEKALRRLNRIAGQIRGICKMLEENRYCMDILSQTRAVTAAIHGVEDLILENHLGTCVAEAMQGGQPDAGKEKIDEIMDFLSRYGRRG
jgi:DNA-binding FrmR family transcriptional regulator